ncbi:hypothetical protein [Mesorhizobium sp. SP-1A]|uniref:hypothetical protein n=1 Tax=Mesorhizobium sp. SP-1A TaxID=3077840 RepID=UPI0028F6D2D8|nr:hypothetical protein [Mesorhizobium sp. SP-1A]
MDNEKYFDADVQRSIQEKAKTFRYWVRMLNYCYWVSMAILPCILLLVPFGWNLILFAMYVAPFLVVVSILERRIASRPYVGAATYFRLNKAWENARVNYTLKDGQYGVGVVDEIRSNGVDAMLLVKSETDGDLLLFPTEVSKVENRYVRYILPACFAVMAAVVVAFIVKSRVS